MSHSPTTKVSEIDIAAGYEKRDVNVLLVVVLALICIGLIASFAVFLNDYFNLTKEQLMRAANAAPDATLMKVRAEEHELLSNYAVVDASKGIYRMPIEQAMKELAARDTANRTASK